MKENLKSVREIAAMFPVFGEWYYWKKASDGVLPCTKIGRKYYLNPEVVKDYLSTVIVEKEGSYARNN